MADVWPLNPRGELMAIAMIETPEAIENLALEIVRVGLDPLQQIRDSR